MEMILDKEDKRSVKPVEMYGQLRYDFLGETTSSKKNERGAHEAFQCGWNTEVCCVKPEHQWQAMSG
jgi:hypothetical protein